MNNTKPKYVCKCKAIDGNRCPYIAPTAYILKGHKIHAHNHSPYDKKAAYTYIASIAKEDAQKGTYRDSLGFPIDKKNRIVPMTYTLDKKGRITDVKPKYLLDRLLIR